jgi:hypothetical protein
VAIKYLPLERLRLELFHNPTNAAKIRKDYRIESSLFGEALESHLFEALGQMQQEPAKAMWSNDAVFEKAVRAIGSNSRPWASFLSGFGKLQSELLNFDVTKVSERFIQDGFDGYAERLRPHLRGLTSGKDSRAILLLAQMLAARPAYYDELRAAYTYFWEFLSKSNSIFQVEAATTVCVALLIGNRQYEGLAKSKIGVGYKIVGMGIPLASEFLRNLGWTGFKPDRHVVEMLEKWYSDEEQEALIGSDVARIRQILGQISSLDLRLLRKSLLGAKTTPPGTPINQADHLVWLYRSTLGRSRAT